MRSARAPNLSSPIHAYRPWRRKADWYLPLRPGTDIALLLAWIHI